MTQLEVAKALGISRQRVHQIEKAALAKMRAHFARTFPELFEEEE